MVAEAAQSGRPDIYSNVHRGLRPCMNRTLEEIGRMDPSDDLDVAAWRSGAGLSLSSDNCKRRASGCGKAQVEWRPRPIGT